MAEHDAAYFYRLADAEAEKARHATSVGSVAAHHRLAEAYLARASSDGALERGGIREEGQPLKGGHHASAASGDILLRELNHRCGNDLQLVVSLLGYRGLQAKTDEARELLHEVAENIAVLARARSEIARQHVPNLRDSLSQVCEALKPYADPRSITITFRVVREPSDLTIEQVTTLALVANELMTNAIKHAFEEGKGGSITVTIDHAADGEALVTVDDDGLPFPELNSQRFSGGEAFLGIGLAKQLMASIGGMLITPTGPQKVFRLKTGATSRDMPV